MERIKTIILIILVATSILLFYALLSGVEQYSTLPRWLTDIPQLSDNEDVVEAKEILLPEIIAPERLIEHSKNKKSMYYLTTNDYSFNIWQEVDQKINLDMNVKIVDIDFSQWQSATSGSAWEFILPGSYPIEVLFPFWHDGEDSYSIKIERLMITDEKKPQILARSVSANKHYNLLLEAPELTQEVFSLKTKTNKGRSYSVFDLGVNNDNITNGVYIAENFLGRYNNLFPEIWVEPERYEPNRWLPKYFSSPNLAREVVLGEAKSQYSIGSKNLILDYSGFPHLDYSYSVLEEDLEDLEELDINYFEAVDISSIFLSDHEISSWVDFKRAVRLTSASIDQNNRYKFDYRNYADALDIGIPILSSDPAFRVRNKDGIVTSMTRHIWKYSRFNYIPVIEIDGAGAIDRLSLDEYKLVTWSNPYVEEVINSFQDHLLEGYYIADVHLAYYVPDNLFSGAFISPYWTVVLTDGNENKVRFFINAMTGFIPKQNSLEFK